MCMRIRHTATDVMQAHEGEAYCRGNHLGMQLFSSLYFMAVIVFVYVILHFVRAVSIRIRHHFIRHKVMHTIVTLKACEEIASGARAAAVEKAQRAIDDCIKQQLLQDEAPNVRVTPPRSTRFEICQAL
jgi:hypothetical protein